MKKYLICFLVLFLFLLIGCKKEKEDDFYTPDLIEASHDYSPVTGPQYSYIVLKGKLENNNYLTDITFNNIIDSSVTKREINYYQVDYTNSNGLINSAFHTFNFQDTQPVYRQNFFPYNNYDNSSLITKLSVLVKYRYEEDGNILKKEEKYSEDVIKFVLNNFNYEYNLDVFKVINNTVESENFYRVRLEIDFSSVSFTNGHIDMQSFIEYSNSKILPFVGLYHYPCVAGPFIMGSDEKISKNESILNIYFELKHHNADGSVAKLYAKIAF